MKRVGVGVIGFGQRGLSFDALVRNHFQAEAFIVGYHDTDTSRLAAAEKWVKPYNGVAKANLNDFLDILGLDIVFVCTPQFAHADPAIAALEAGKNVFVEKPMATTLEDCDRMLAAREGSNWMVSSPMLVSALSGRLTSSMTLSSTSPEVPTVSGELGW